MAPITSTTQPAGSTVAASWPSLISKPPRIRTGHPGYSDPIDEQIFDVGVINAIANSQYWKDTAIIIAYDDSDAGTITSPSDQWSINPPSRTMLSLARAIAALLTRLPLLCAHRAVGRLRSAPCCSWISALREQNYIDHRATDQSSILRFIEDNWDLGRIGNDSSDVKAGTLDGMFDFDDHNLAPKLDLGPVHWRGAQV